MPDAKNSDAKSDKPAPPKITDPFLQIRDTFESIAVAVILALLFRAFIAEAFVIPTGSMAPTLMGRHVDVSCPECKYRYQASASGERTREDALTGYRVSDARCPLCGYRKDLDYTGTWSNDLSFSGDRIIVSKYSYEFQDPQRWDVIVFKFPEGAQQNYIKRLVGLPGETLEIAGGNVYVTKQGEPPHQIARKPPAKLLAMLQLVHDTAHNSPMLVGSGWPSRWQPHADGWTTSDDQTQFSLAASSGESVLRYHHFDPSESDWQTIRQGGKVEVGDWEGRLISDFYAYNCGRYIDYNEYLNTPGEAPEPTFYERNSGSPPFGQYWVDDLAMECEIEISEATGEIVLDLVRAGTHHVCRVDVKTGAAVLSNKDAIGGVIPFQDGEKLLDSVKATTAVRGTGKHRFRLSNVDHEVLLWVNDRLVNFDGPTVYDAPDLMLPDVESADGDLAPAGVGGVNQAMKVSHLRILRDKYYVACDSSIEEYGDISAIRDFNFDRHQQIAQMLAHPVPEVLKAVLGSRRTRTITLEQDQFMPLGDNSPASSDARYWTYPYVERKLLVGKALFIYWPHSWYQPPFMPDFTRMQPIH